MSKKILIVDDNEMDVEFLKRALSPLGHEIVSAAYEDDAFALLGKFKFDLIISDFNLGPTNADDFVHRLKETSSLNDISLIVVTGVIPPDSMIKNIKQFGIKMVTKDELRDGEFLNIVQKNLVL